MKLKIAVLPGDGIGPEIMKQGVAVMDAIAEKFGHEFTYEEALCGAHAIDAAGQGRALLTHHLVLEELLEELIFDDLFRKQFIFFLFLPA